MPRWGVALDFDEHVEIVQLPFDTKAGTVKG